MKSLSDLLGAGRPTVPTTDDFPRAVGSRLRLQRMAFAWRQSDLAIRAGVSVQTVKAVEKGQSIAYDSLLRLLLALGQGGDFLQMLESPNFPDLASHERYLALRKAPVKSLGHRRVRLKPSESA